MAYKDKETRNRHNRERYALMSPLEKRARRGEWCGESGAGRRGSAMRGSAMHGTGIRGTGIRGTGIRGTGIRGKIKGRKGRAFVGVDGEGGNISGRHVYNLLAVGTLAISSKTRLTTLECLGFLADLDTSYLYVSYFFDYDVTKILEDIPRDKIQSLLDRDTREHPSGKYFIPVKWKGFEFDYMPGKEFKVRRVGGRFVTISDVGSFFQCSFLKALRDWGVGSKEELETIERGKMARAEFTELVEDTEKYNQLEIKLLVELMEKYREVFSELDIYPWKWQGPGQIAGAVLKMHDVIRNSDICVPDEVWSMAQASYTAGWFEVAKFGNTTGPIYSADINSAYPWAMLKLPCLEHGKWERTTTPAGLYIAHIEWEGDVGGRWHSFPHRNEVGNISHPAHGRAYVWSYEIDNKFDYDKVEVLDAWEYHKTCSCEPFSFVEELYKLRKELGKNSKGLALKTTINSLYGKLAQSVGKPKYSNPIWASLITSHCRGQLLSAMRDDPEGVIMVATDALYSTSKPKVRESQELGDWETEIYQEVFIIQPGVYIADGALRAIKTRGTNRQVLMNELETVKENWNFFIKNARPKNYRTISQLTSTELGIRRFYSLRIANTRTDYEGYVGTWREETRRVGFDWAAKRDIRRWIVEGESILTFPIRKPKTLESQPYRRNIGGGGEFALNELLMDQPDYMRETLGGE